MSRLDIDTILARANAATEGPWEIIEDICGSRVRAGGMVFATPYRLEHGSGPCEQQRADNMFVASARTDIPALCAEVRKLRASLVALVDACEAVDALCRAEPEIAQALSPYYPDADDAATDDLLGLIRSVLSGADRGNK